MAEKVQRTILLICLAAILVHCAQQEDPEPAATNGFDRTKSDPKAIEVVNQMWEALGGKKNWQQARYLSYRWIVERNGENVADYRHDWDRYTNRYRVEGTNRDGQHFVALFNTESKEGKVYLDGTEMPPDSNKVKMINRAYGRFINDSYWLVMPYKLNDPGVILAYEGERELAGRKYDLIKLTFEEVGLTPGDTYWAYVDQADHFMHKWEYVLQGWGEDREPSGSWWKDWQTIGGIKLAMSKEFEGRAGRIYFKDVRVSQTVDEGVFQLTSRTF